MHFPNRHDLYHFLHIPSFFGSNSGCGSAPLQECNGPESGNSEKIFRSRDGREGGEAEVLFPAFAVFASFAQDIWFRLCRAANHQSSAITEGRPHLGCGRIQSALGQLKFIAQMGQSGPAFHSTGKRGVESKSAARRRGTAAETVRRHVHPVSRL